MIAAMPLIEASQCSFLRETKGGELIFRKPFFDSVALLVISLVGLTAPIVEIWSAADSSRSPTGTAEVMETLLLGFLLVSLHWTVALFFFFMSFPCETRINLGQRTFERVTRRWLWGRKTLRGSLDEMAGVCITGRGNVLLALKRPRGLLYGIELGRTAARESAAGLAQQFSTVLDLPFIKIPW
jgi:hypothetical protein